MKLPLNASVHYFQSFLSKNESTKLYQHLIQFEELTSLLKIQTASGDVFEQNYGKLMFLDDVLLKENKFPKEAWGENRKWSNEMIQIKKRVEKHTNTSFETCVCIYYPDGNSGVDFHSDYTAFGDTALIPSISLGEEREFILREKDSREEHITLLENGSLIIMGENCQENYEHSLPINPKYEKGRINLTFRKYGFHK